MPILRLILGDQLNSSHSWFATIDPSVTYCLMETRSETDYAPHHIQKVCGFFANMRHFAAQLRSQGHQVRYLALDDPNNKRSFTENILWLLQELAATAVEYQLPDEWRLDQELSKLKTILPVPVTSVDTEHFYTSRHELATLFAGKRQFLMESFYRTMRKKHRILLDTDGNPLGGSWNFDQENRKRLPKKLPIPPPLDFSHSVADLVQLLRNQQVATIGVIPHDILPYPIGRAEALQVLAYFCQHLLPNFGAYQDAMDTAQPFLFHSRLSFALNLKLLTPHEVVTAAITAWQQNPAAIPLASLEGFVRQILGWREYMRGVYWATMPRYKSLNFLNHTAKLPGYFWTGETGMNCVKHAVSQSLQYGYAHHIQRLMITGNFALLAGIDPEAIDQWYLGIYLDAIEWVQITNTRGMSQYADGGIVGTKPYVASANYIKKMSNYCDRCRYNPAQRHGTGACPFNSLYWDFFERHRALLANNPRIGMAYRVLDKFPPEEKAAIMQHAARVKAEIEEL